LEPADVNGDGGLGLTEQKISERFDAALRGLGAQRKVRELRIEQQFAEIVGPAVAPLCRAVALERGRLMIATAHGALAQQLHQESPKIIASMNDKIGAGAVRRLAFCAMDGRPTRPRTGEAPFAPPGAGSPTSGPE